jgi:hypothetical protein
VRRSKLEAEQDAARIKSEKSKRFDVENEAAGIKTNEVDRQPVEAEKEDARIKAEVLRLQWARLAKEAERLRVEADDGKARINMNSDRLRIKAEQEVAKIKEEAEEIADKKEWRVTVSSEAVRLNARAKRSSIIFDTNQRNLLSQKLVYDSQAMTRRRIRQVDDIVERQAQQEESGEISSMHAVGNKAVAFLAKTRLLAEMMVKRQAKVKIDREYRQMQEAERIEEEAIAEANEILRVETVQEAARIEEEAVAESNEILRVEAVEARVAKKVAQDMSRADMEEVPCTIPFPSASMRLVYGRRCVLIPSRKKENRNEFENDADISVPPPIIILGGMAQYIESWQPHFIDLSRERDVLMIEYVGSGLGHGHDSENSVSDVSGSFIANSSFVSSSDVTN